MKKIFITIFGVLLFSTMFAQSEFTEIPNVVVTENEQCVLVRTSDKCIAEQLTYSSQVLRSYYDRGERVFVLEKDRYAYAVHFVASASNFACNRLLSMKYDLERGIYYEEVKN